jgi:hypothetical protein
MALSFVCDNCGDSADFFVQFRIVRFTDGGLKEIHTVSRLDSCTDDVSELVTEALQRKTQYEFKDNEAFHSVEITEIGIDDANDKDTTS